MEQVENTVSGIEDKVAELDWSVKDNGKSAKKYEYNMQDLWDTFKWPKLWS
jgi:hypothetical protein